MIKVSGSHFVDDYGRFLLLRGVNLGGSSKVPAKPNGATFRSEGFYNHRDVSFIGRPFSLEEAGEHFTRLKKWGFSFLRLLVTWEAIEHAGPGVYDEAYLDYLYQIVKKAAESGISVFIDPHQDCWSRFSGGDGAPGWTFEAVGLDITRFMETGAALTHQEHGDPFPSMIWPTNYGKLANLTLWTLFWAGNDFAPQTLAGGVPVQDYLQNHYIHAVQQVALRLKDLPNVVGYDTLNEPFAGMIGMADLETGFGYVLKVGDTPTVFQTMLLGAGIPQEVGVYRFTLRGMQKKGVRRVNETGTSAWLPGFADIWKQHGIWEAGATGKPRLLKPDYFSRVKDRKVDFYQDYFHPFVLRYITAIRRAAPQAIIFVEGDPLHGSLPLDSLEATDLVYEAYWYDGMTLMMKNFYDFFTIDIITSKPVIGRKKVRQAFSRQIGRLSEAAKGKTGSLPVLIGEVGIPFDMQKKKAYRTGNFSRQVKALDATMQALDANLVSFTLWNYTADNDNAHGDQWNDEDLSIYSRDQKTGSGSIHDGGHALEAAVRPYATAIPGEPLAMCFDMKKKVYDFAFRWDAKIQAPLEIFVPEYQYPGGFRVEAPHCRVETSPEEQKAMIYPESKEGEYRVRITPARG